MYVYNFRAEVFRVRHSLSSEVFFFSCFILFPPSGFLSGDASRLVEVGPLPNQLTTEQINFDANFNQRLADESLIVLKQILRDQAGVVDGTLLA